MPPETAPSSEPGSVTVTAAGSQGRFCGGDGGVIYEYEGPQFGRQWVEEPCEKCNGWHPDQRERPAGDYYRPAGPRIGWLRRRRLNRAR